MSGATVAAASGVGFGLFQMRVDVHAHVIVPEVLRDAAPAEAWRPRVGARMTTVDVVVAGAGHNSLITAAYLAQAGYEVVVLDARPIRPGARSSASAPSRRTSPTTRSSRRSSRAPWTSRRRTAT